MNPKINLGSKLGTALNIKMIYWVASGWMTATSMLHSNWWDLILNWSISVVCKTHCLVTHSTLTLCLLRCSFWRKLLDNSEHKWHSTARTKKRIVSTQKLTSEFAGIYDVIIMHTLIMTLYPPLHRGSLIVLIVVCLQLPMQWHFAMSWRIDLWREDDEETPGSIFRHFPAHKRQISCHTHKKEVVSVYCLCWQPKGDGDKMISCDKCGEWYHLSNNQVPPQAWF